MASGRPVPPKKSGGSSSNHHDFAGFANSITASFTDPAPIAQEAIARDLAEDSDTDVEHWEGSRGRDRYRDDDDDDENASSGSEPENGDSVMYRRPSENAFGMLRPALAPQENASLLSRIERKQSRDAERSLLRDNHILPPKHHAPEHRGLVGRLYRRLFSTKVPRGRGGDEEAPAVNVVPPTPMETETDPLLSSEGSRHHSSSQGQGLQQDGLPLSEQWDAAVAAGQIRTTWQREAKTLISYSGSLLVTFTLQYSISITSILAVGKIGKLELGAVSLATMTANITGYAIIQGLATCLDTLCPQAYGSGHKHLVGLQLQRMTWFLLLLVIPIGVIWVNSTELLALMIPERRSAELAGMYLKISPLGLPAFAVFEGSKRFVQAQGLFHACTYVSMIVAPVNIFINWLLVWKLDWGYVGAPWAVVITQNIMPVLLFLYVYFIDGYQCWGGFSRRALTNWGPMIRLALPGMIMLTAEFIAFEILTIFSSRFGTSTLAAQTVAVTLTATTFRLPLALSVAGSTRVANLIGAQLVDAAKTSASVMTTAGVAVGIFNTLAVWVFRHQIGYLFTDDEEVISILLEVMPLLALLQVFDAMACVSHGILRGLGRQEFGGYANIFVYYVLALPISFGCAFGLGWNITGLWLGVTLGLGLVAVVEFVFAYYYDWERAAADAANRNASG